MLSFIISTVDRECLLAAWLDWGEVFVYAYAWSTRCLNTAWHMLDDRQVRIWGATGVLYSF